MGLRASGLGLRRLLVEQGCRAYDKLLEGLFGVFFSAAPKLYISLHAPKALQLLSSYCQLGPTAAESAQY